ncbi:dipeptidyl carboxypeptidase [Rheinheimera sp. SA_1]|uniref:M3 family metallopeptidase n=1 Tax=Rheinheimera sp. SA_1 TaxID=1827365 RepID=UPI0008019F29|nr:M3 family metallopeptidase [Rheinheimera sp. SA_1]OBP16689.1 dipeptidyl carboxypeptidase [Rheinheimera sp. SA_1]
MNKTMVATAVAAVLALSACTDNSAPAQQETTQAAAPAAEVTAEQTPVAATNPLLVASTLQYGAPEFDKIKVEHYQPAMEQGIVEHTAEIEKIANNTEAATFENTIVAMEKSGELLDRASTVFFNMTGTISNPEILKIQSAMAPKLAAHGDNINLNPTLFARIQAIYANRANLNLDAEALRLTEVYYDRFVRAGAKLTDEQKTKIRALNEEHSKLTNQFGQNLLQITKDIAVFVDSKEQLAGMSDAEITAAAEGAKAAGKEGKFIVALTNTTRQPVLSVLENRELRKQIWEASAYRGTTGETDNRPIVSRLAQIRAERAQLLGYDSWADYQLEQAMAQKPQAVLSMLGGMAPAVVANTKLEAAAIQEMIKSTGGDFELQPWDWEFYAEKVRKAKFDLDENEVKQYFEFERVLQDGVFFTMNKLFGITMKPRPDLPGYHPDVKAYEVFDADGSSIGLFYADYFAREGKRGGAWMSSFVDQSGLIGTKPVIVNVMNIPKGPAGEPTLVSYDNVTTMFHEFGHALHGMFSAVKYPTLAGTSVSRDFVEFPSTFQEDWAAYPQVIANYAKHYKTGEPIPAELLAKIMKSRSFNQGFDTLEYLAAALVDMEWHALKADAPLQDVEKFEAEALKKHGVDIAAVPPRYKSTFFSHSIGGGYSAGYYAYMWSEILAADAFAYVQSQGGLKLENGQNYRKHILSVGNTLPPMEAYKNFRGQEPTTDALLIRRGLKTAVN